MTHRLAMRVQELIAASWSDAAVAQVIRTALMGWVDLVVGVARKAERELGGSAR
jgi:hypothetical protein